jgi:hypothetical protein
MELRISGLTEGLEVPLMVLLYDNWGYEKAVLASSSSSRRAVETNADTISRVERIEAIELILSRASRAWHWRQFCEPVSHFRASRSPVRLGSPPCCILDDATMPRRRNYFCSLFMMERIITIR